MFDDWSDFPQQFWLKVVDADPDHKDVPELHDPGHNLAVEVDRVAPVSLPYDGLLQHAADQVGHFSRVQKDGNVADELKNGQKTSGNREKEQNRLAVFGHEVSRINKSLIK